MADAVIPTAEPAPEEVPVEKFQWVSEGNQIFWLTAEELAAKENG